MFTKRNLNHKILFILVIGLIVAKSFVWLYAFPPFQSPDEIPHFAYTLFVAEKNRLPKEGENTGSMELVKSISYLDMNKLALHKEKKLNYSKENKEERKRQIAGLNKEEYRTDFSSPDFGALVTPPLYYTLAAIPYKLFYHNDLLTRILVIKIFSILLSFGVFYFVFKGGLLLFKKKITAVLFGLIVFLQPMFSMLSIATGPDIFVFFLFSVLFYLVTKTIHKGKLDLRENLSMVSVVALSFLTKQYAVILLFMYLSTLLILFINKSLKVKALFLNSVMVVISSLVVSGWWYLKFSPKATLPTGSRFPLYEYPKLCLLKFSFIVNSYWGIFGWLDTPVNLNKFYPIFLLIIFVTIAGMIYFFRVEKDKTRRSVAWVFSLTVAFTVLLLGFIDYKYSTRQLAFLQGRYFLITLPLNTYLFIQATSALAKRKHEDMVVFCIFILALLLNMVCLYYYIIPRYNVF